jgi:hypothetical protein
MFTRNRPLKKDEINRFHYREFGNLTRSIDPLLLCYWRTTAEEKLRSESLRDGLMITSPHTAIAVEAKWSERRYETVVNWAEKSER